MKVLFNLTPIVLLLQKHSLLFFCYLAAMVALRSTAVNYSLVGEKPYDLVYGGLWKACIVKNGRERCEPLLTGQGMS